MGFKHFFQLIRYKNLLLLAFMQLLFSFVIISNKSVSSFDSSKLILLILATVLLAAAGNVINDFFDVNVDKINKPNKVLVGNVISKKNTLLLYYCLIFFGFVSGFILAYICNKLIYSFIFIGISIVLYWYSKSFKKIALLGNFIVSFFIALSIVMIVIFPSFDFKIFKTFPFLLYSLFAYASFAFSLNFIREIVKDIEDIDGDFSQNMKTLPILIGRKRVKFFVFYLSFIPFMFAVFLTSYINQLLFSVYSIIFIVIPLGYFIYQIKETQSKKKLHQLSTLLKLIMFFGILSIIILFKT